MLKLITNEENALMLKASIHKAALGIQDWTGVPRDNLSSTMV